MRIFELCIKVNPWKGEEKGKRRRNGRNSKNKEEKIEYLCDKRVSSSHLSENASKGPLPFCLLSLEQPILMSGRTTSFKRKSHKKELSSSLYSYRCQPKRIPRKTKNHLIKHTYFITKLIM